MRDAGLNTMELFVPPCSRSLSSPSKFPLPLRDIGEANSGSKDRLPCKTKVLLYLATVIVYVTLLVKFNCYC